ncbi:hypothetical protein J8I26_13830 [Herbaspirillum sp. LeCh32-8]|uniref:hypothetical protein n=1 Tax=Herbaspirillum sp. LeCh32-8 TaxID=2821356 RepID=UPI001AE28A9C|nr:hypothetical protein [Herbaspirillum sp. LeCh32-8]MBP0599195.1 hypothetical protein [Herbaspirillum sp. LeCh32-8]
MKLKAIQMLALTVGVLAAWSLRKAMREGNADMPSALGDAGRKLSSTLQGAAGAIVDGLDEADPPRNRMPSVGDLPP